MTASLSPRYLSRNARISIVNAGFGGAQQKPGVESAPLAIIDTGLNNIIDNADRTSTPQTQAIDYMALKPVNDQSHRGMNNPRWVSAVTKSISEQVYTQAIDGNLVLTLGGDHSIAIGTLTGSAKAVHERYGPQQKMGIVYIDAHADLNSPEDSESGNIHGMALAFASGWASSAEPGIFDWIMSERLVNLDKVVYIGLRDVDDAEKETIKNKGMLTFWMDHFFDTLEHLNDVPIHVSFDIDGLDPIVAPSTGLPVPRGLSLSDGVSIMSQISASGRLIAMDVVEVNPSIGSEDDLQKTLQATFEVVKAAITNTP